MNRNATLSYDGISVTSEKHEYHGGRIGASIDVFIGKGRVSASSQYWGLENSQASVQKHEYRFLQRIETIEDARMASELDLADNSFRDACGDHYVYGIRYGGEVYITLAIDLMSAEAKKVIQKKIKVSLLGGLIKKEKTVVDTINSYTTNALVSLSVHSRGLDLSFAGLNEDLVSYCTMDSYEICIEQYQSYMNAIKGYDELNIPYNVIVDYTVRPYSGPNFGLVRKSPLPSIRTILKPLLDLYYVAAAEHSALRRLELATGSLTEEQSAKMVKMSTAMTRALDVRDNCMALTGEDRSILCSQLILTYANEFEYIK